MSHSLSVGKVGEKHIKITQCSLLFLILDGVSVIKTNLKVSTQKNFRPTSDLLDREREREREAKKPTEEEMIMRMPAICLWGVGVCNCVSTV